MGLGLEESIRRLLLFRMAVLGIKGDLPNVCGVGVLVWKLIAGFAASSAWNNIDPHRRRLVALTP